MAGSDLPSSSRGSPPPRSAKRKRGDDDHSAGPPPSLPSRATRSSAAAREAVAHAVRMARHAVRVAQRAATGALWATRTGRGSRRGRGLGGVERTREVILGVRLARAVHLPKDIADSLYPKEIVPLGVQQQASVPEWNAPSKEERLDYRAATLTKLGTIVCPLNMDISATDESEKTRKELVDNCNCSHPGSEDCVQVHVMKARVWIKHQLGEEAFKNCGLDAMGEQVGELWTAVDKKKLEDASKSTPQNKHQKFMKIAKQLSQKDTKDLAKYYYNVFLPKRLARLTRAEHKKDEGVDTADEKSGLDDDTNEHRPRKKRNSSGSSSTRGRKKKDLTSGPTVRSQRKKN